MDGTRIQTKAMDGCEWRIWDTAGQGHGRSIEDYRRLAQIHCSEMIAVPAHISVVMQYWSPISKKIL